MRITIWCLMGLLVSNCCQPMSLLRIEELICYLNPTLSENRINEYARAIRQYSTRYDVDENVVASVIAVESKYNYHAVGKKGEIGLMQLRPKFFGKASELFDPWVNICKGVKYLRGLEIVFGPIYSNHRWVEHYNCGPNSHPHRYRYTKRVMGYYQLLTGQQ